MKMRNKTLRDWIYTWSYVTTAFTRRKAVSMAEAEGGSVYFKRTKDSLKNKISWGLNITSSRVLLYFVSAELREIF